MIVLAVRWYLRFGLSYRDVEELLAVRGIQADHVTIYRWVLRFTPLLAEAARPCRHAVGDRWFVDETYVKVAGQWRYVYRAIDQFGQVIDVFVAARRDTIAAHRFFERAVGMTKVRPVEVVSPAHSPARTMPCGPRPQGIVQRDHALTASQDQQAVGEMLAGGMVAKPKHRPGHSGGSARHSTVAF